MPMPDKLERISEKFGRLFEDLDELKQRVSRIEARDELEREQLNAIADKVDGISASLHEILGKEAVRSSIYGVIGAIISGVVIWIITLVKDVK